MRRYILVNNVHAFAPSPEEKSISIIITESRLPASARIEINRRIVEKLETVLSFFPSFLPSFLPSFFLSFSGSFEKR